MIEAMEDRRAMPQSFLSLTVSIWWCVYQALLLFALVGVAVTPSSEDRTCIQKSAGASERASSRCVHICQYSYKKKIQICPHFFYCVMWLWEYLVFSHFAMLDSVPFCKNSGRHLDSWAGVVATLTCAACLRHAFRITQSIIFPFTHVPNGKYQKYSQSTSSVYFLYAPEQSIYVFLHWWTV